MTKTKKSNKIIIVAAVIALAVIAAVFGIVYFFFGEKPVEGTKAITVTVVDNTGAEKTYQSKTDAE